MAFLLISVMVLSGIHVSSASAALVVFNDEAQFLAAAGPLDFEGFEQTAPGFTGSSRVLSDFIIGPLDADISVLQILNDPAFVSEGTQSAGGNTTGMFLVFHTPITALGFTIVDFGDAGTQDTLQLTLALSGTIVDTIQVASASEPFQPLRFFGLISTAPFSSVELRKTEVDDFFAIDAVHSEIATSVREPSTVLLTALGLGGIVVWVTRRTNALQRDAWGHRRNQLYGFPTIHAIRAQRD